jgi:hypothetical protein
LRVRLIGILAGTAALALGAPGAALAQDPEPENVVNITVPSRGELNRLAETGTDLDHNLVSNDDGSFSIDAVITPTEVQDLRSQGFDVSDTVVNLQAARAAALASQPKGKSKSVGGGIPLLVAESANLKILRSDYYTTTGNGKRLSVEAKSAKGQTDVLTIRWDNGPGTEMGSGGSSTLQAFVDEGAYLYHRRNITIPTANNRPNLVEVSSSLSGEKLTFNTKLWGEEPTGSPGNPYKQDFITGYLNPTQVYDRLKSLHERFPALSDLIPLPNLTNGFRRKAQGQFGATTNATTQASVVVVESKLYGNEGGDGMTAELKNPGVANATLSTVRATRGITVNLATDASGAITSTAAQVVEAINTTGGSPIRAFLYRTNAGAGVVAAGTQTLTDNLNPPAGISQDPFRGYVLRIGAGARNGERIGVFLYSQEHAREWQTPLVTLETAERLLSNYGTDPFTTELLDNVEVFVLPSVNPDGGHYSFFGNTGQRRNMVNHCPANGNNEPGARNSWGVDVNRNYSEGSWWDGYGGNVSGSCTSDTYAGPFEHSEAESRNVTWVADTFTNIKFSMNVHSSGNYFMWAPGSYKNVTREPMPYAPLGDEAYFWGSAGRVISSIKKYRNLAVTPGQTGPVQDVLYSAAGNSGDQLWYRNHIYAWDFEVGTSFMPAWDEAHAETMEFANGLVELVNIAKDFAHDGSTPVSELLLTTGPGVAKIKFDANEPASVYYNKDGVRPTFQNSLLYAPGGVREGGETITLTNTNTTPRTVTLTWFAVDAAGNIENNYKPLPGNASALYRRQTITIPGATAGAEPDPAPVPEPLPEALPEPQPQSNTGTSSDSDIATVLKTSTVAGVGGTGRPALNNAAKRKAEANRKAAMKKAAALKAKQRKAALRKKAAARAKAHR